MKALLGGIPQHAIPVSLWERRLARAHRAVESRGKGAGVVGWQARKLVTRILLIACWLALGGLELAAWREEGISSSYFEERMRIRMPHHGTPEADAQIIAAVSREDALRSQWELHWNKARRIRLIEKAVILLMGIIFIAGRYVAREERESN